MVSMASVRGLQAVLRDPVLAGQPVLQERVGAGRKNGGPTKEHALIVRRVSPSNGAHQARSGVSIGGSSLRHRLHLPQLISGADSRSPVTKYILPLFIGGEQKEAPQSGTEGDRGGMALSRRL